MKPPDIFVPEYIHNQLENGWYFFGDLAGFALTSAIFLMVQSLYLLILAGIRISYCSFYCRHLDFFKFRCFYYFARTAKFNTTYINFFLTTMSTLMFNNMPVEHSVRNAPIYNFRTSYFWNVEIFYGSVIYKITHSNLVAIRPRYLIKDS